MPEEEQNKIPEKLKDLMKKKMDNNHKFSISDYESIEEAPLLDETKAIMAVLYRDFLADEKEKIEYKQAKLQELKEIQAKKSNINYEIPKETYNIYNTPVKPEIKEGYNSFNSQVNTQKQPVQFNTSQTQNISNETALTKIEENKWYKKFINFFKEKFKRYIEKKYFERIPQNMIISIFRDFWKITFKLDNEDCNINRKINLEFLILTMREYKLKILEDIQKEKDKYNNISDSEEIAIYLVEFMYYFPEVYNYLKEDNKIAIEVVVNKNNDYKTIAYYTSKNIEEHISTLNTINFINKHTRELLEKKIKDEGKEILLLDKYIDCFGNSVCFDDADLNFDVMIRPNISRMQQRQIETLIEKINKNNQIYNRARSEYDNNDIIKKSNINWKKIDLKKYNNFKYDKMLLIEDDLPF